MYLAVRPTSEELKSLVSKLEEASALTSRGKAMKRTCDLFNSDRKVISWKFNEWDYGKNNIKLPCNARGLFILDDNKNPEIVARGYDKFFSVDEVPFTKWQWIEENTVGPYEISLKANGCIILFSGLADGTLVTCSKHSTGPREDTDRNHAKAGEQFLFHQLQKLNIDPKKFAKELYDLNVTAVAEYCDDSFEEHILAYTENNAGLYLHGLNLNQPLFNTLGMHQVNQFGSKYGFMPLETIIMDDINMLRPFLEDRAKTGSYEGKEIEGFVIRSHKLDGNAFFFKYKFEEPYLMYRQWREVTKDYIQTKSRISNFRKHKFITNKYLDFVIPLLNNDERLCQDYLNSFGIINLRNMFLNYYGMTGMEILNHEKLEELALRNAVDYNQIDENTKFIIIPIAVIGCGKTTTSMTLTNIYPQTWGHIQNDDITGKDKVMLMKKSLELLSKPGMKCVIIDRNNHQFRERKQLFEWLEEYKEDYLPYDANIKVVALSFADYDDLETVRELTIKRVYNRGDDHQSIKASQFGEKKVLGIMDGFIKRYQQVNESRSPDNLFDFVIHLKVLREESSLNNTKIILQKLYEKYPILVPVIPSEELIESSFRKSKEYKPKVTKIIRNSNNSGNKKDSILSNIQMHLEKRKIKPVYFSANINDISIIKFELQKLVNFGGFSETDNIIIKDIVNGNKLLPSFHITLAHVGSCKNGSPEQQQLWLEYSNHYIPVVKKITKNNKTGCNDELPLNIHTEDRLKFTIRRICWDSNIVTAIIDIDKNGILSSDGKLLPNLICANDKPHITIAILKEGVRPFYSNELCRKVEKNELNDDIRIFDVLNPTVHEGTITINF